MRDVEVVETELLLSDLEIVGRQRLKAEKAARVGDQAAAAALPVLRQVEAGLNRGQWARDLGLSSREKEKFQATPLLTLKSCLFVPNLNVEEFRDGVLSGPR